ncbi:hypothetical protein [Agromyces humi]|uniref:hypothetical protein n=1 Tax=Agromyces humi TaxID=1766800 RepID=UPI00135A3270|nr:hypothetical protein [Agromyces humi]
MTTRRNAAGQLYSTRDGRFVDDPRVAELRDPIPALDPVTYADFYADDDEPAAALFGIPDLITGPYGKHGYTVDGRVDRVQYDGDTSARHVWKGDIRDAAGTAVGSFQRSFLDDGTVTHDDLHIFDPAGRGGGFATEFNAAAEAEYIRMGFTKIITMAVGDGAYVWARRGFEINDESGVAGAARQDVALAMRKKAAGEPFSLDNMNPRKLTDADRERVLKMADQIEFGSKNVTIRDVANLNVEGFPNLGRQILCSGVSWPGRRTIGD